ncbi:unnamed protein product [Strongylus vulgaris]|uniref:PABS domain-containing protein n=1 Tax=Strongylus vulgaris TaxID=40348 RepID=A0A3P7K3H9_STRVU|nr:unnamed protein product [Strongylus vulgaris]
MWECIESNLLNITVVEMDSTITEIAKKWFDVVEEENHRLIVEDGLAFLVEAGKRGEKFDVIALDACDEAIKSPCPSKVFRNVEVIEKFKLALTSTGLLRLSCL